MYRGYECHWTCNGRDGVLHALILPDPIPFGICTPSLSPFYHSFPSPPFFRNNLFPQLICSLSPPRIDHFQKHAHRRQATPQITRGNGLPQGHFPEPDQNGILPRIRSFPLGGFWRHPSHSILWSVGSRKEDTHHGSVARDVWKRSGEGEFSIRISSIAACGEARIQSDFPR